MRSRCPALDTCCIGAVLLLNRWAERWPVGDYIAGNGLLQSWLGMHCCLRHVVLLILTSSTQAQRGCRTSTLLLAWLKGDVLAPAPPAPTGMARLGCDSLDKLKAKLPALRAELQEPDKFRQIYNFAYLFSRCGVPRCASFGWGHRCQLLTAAASASTLCQRKVLC